MGNILLIGCLMIMAGTGFWATDKFDRFLEENYRGNCEKETAEEPALKTGPEEAAAEAVEEPAAKPAEKPAAKPAAKPWGPQRFVSGQQIRRLNVNPVQKLNVDIQRRK